jgi:hypothetical protein
MADRGGFVNVPGIGRRFRTPEGEYRYGAPGDVTAGIIPRIEKFFRKAVCSNRFPLQGDPTGKNYIPGNMQVPSSRFQQRLYFLLLQTQPLEAAVVSLNSRRNP